MTPKTLPVPERLQAVEPYSVPVSGLPCDLKLDGNEGPEPVFPEAWPVGAEVLRRYPQAEALRDALALRHRVDPARILVTGGADDGLDRACRASLGPGRNLVLPWPSFVMLRRYADLTGAAVRTVPWWSARYPTQEVLEAVDANTSAIAVVSPNNPTGAVAVPDDLDRLASGAPQSLLLVDGAYGEFADTDLTQRALELPNALVFRTFSKAWGLAGLRVGYVIGPPAWIRALAAAGQPYPAASPSLALALRQLETGEEAMREFVTQVRREREVLVERLAAWGASPLPSQGNFVLARVARTQDVWQDLARAGIAVRRFPGDPELDGFLRITCPGSAAAFDRLLGALESILQPGATPVVAATSAEPGERGAITARVTRETRVAVKLNLDGTGVRQVATGIGFLDHMIASLAFHAGFDLELRAAGDLYIDDHHTVEDTALALGDAVRSALGERSGIARFGFAYAPLDEALARAVVDCSGRGHAEVQLGLRRERLGGLATENATHWFQSFAGASGITLHVDVLRGDNDHHKLEAAFKATALALRQAFALRGGAIPSTKGVLA